MDRGTRVVTLSALSRPTLIQLKWTALTVAVFFGLVSVAQYWFVRSQTRGVVTQTLIREAQDINEHIHYTTGPDLAAYNKAFVESNTFQLISRDGTVIDTEGINGAYAPDFLPRVGIPWLKDSGNQPISYVSPLGEHWLLLTVPLAGGYGVVGLSEFDRMADPASALQENAKLFPAGVATIGDYNPSAFDNEIQHAVVADDGRLLRAGGRIPFQVDPMLVGRQSTDSGDKLADDGNPYYVLYTPVTDSRGNPAGTIIGYQATSQQQAALHNMLLFAALLGTLSFATFVGLAIASLLKHESEKQEIRAAFQNYFSPQILEAILREPSRLESQRREVTIMFSDIRSFTSLSEKIAPRQLTKMLQEYFDEMTEEVIASEGVVDKIIGDAIMAFWGAPIDQPDHADRAVRAAKGMVKRLERLKAQWATEGLPTLDIGIAINLGVATVGNVGSRRRFDYTLIGDAVNVASRLEGLNKQFNSHIIISESTKKHLTLEVDTVDLGEVPIRGREGTVHIYEVRSEA
jgi:class 3 adenylate cyclase